MPAKYLKIANKLQEDIFQGLYNETGFLPTELLSEKPTEVSSNSPEARILVICSLTVACLTSNNMYWSSFFVTL